MHNLTRYNWTPGAPRAGRDFKTGAILFAIPLTARFVDVLLAGGTSLLVGVWWWVCHRAATGRRLAAKALIAMSVFSILGVFATLFLVRTHPLHEQLFGRPPFVPEYSRALVLAGLVVVCNLAALFFLIGALRKSKAPEPATRSVTKTKAKALGWATFVLLAMVPILLSPLRPWCRSYSHRLGQAHQSPELTGMRGCGPYWSGRCIRH